MTIEISIMIAPPSISWGIERPVLAEVFATSSNAPGYTTKEYPPSTC